MKTSEGFRRARERVAAGTEFICVALESRGIPNNCRLIIRERMESFRFGITLETWLNRKHRIDVDFIRNKDRQMRLYRLRWLDSLIAEFEAKGD